MGTYKVPQNVESEDKILGPLSLKQFIYAMIGVGWGLLTFAILQKAIVIWIFVGLPPALALLALGLYQREDQPLETYMLAVASFIGRPKVRFWEKEPIAEVFKLEPPPPKPEIARRDPREVRGQLSKLANIVDTRGWSAKEASVQEPEEAPVVDLQDRLGVEQIASGTNFVTEPATVTAADDILDTQNNPNAQAVGNLIENTVKSVREEALEKMKQRATSHPSKTPSKPSVSTMTPAPTPDILKLATEGGDLTVAQIAAQAHKQQATLQEGQAVSIRNANARA
ncbi:MAG TPA: PrgI family protein [Candidatus Saccharimonadales bacterium]|nr:PrgI family protein [Candidatus Saccharimonadales bacterium]